MKSALAFALIALSCFSLPAQIPNRVLYTDPAMEAHVQWRSDTLLIYSSPEQRKFGQPEFILFPQERNTWEQWLTQLPIDTLVKRYKQKGRLPMPEPGALRPLPFRGTPDPDQPLKGWRIALDPGHMAGDLTFAKEVEGKYMTMPAAPETYGHSIGFFESELTLATAMILRDSLERLGATVLITRPKLGIASHGLSFEEWKKTAFTDSLNRAVKRGDMSWSKAIYWAERADDAVVFQSWFNRSDLHHRIDMIRAFQPHLTLIIHYNVDVSNWQQRQANNDFLPGTENYSMAFVPGSFLPGELSSVEDRVMLLRLLITDDYEQSVKLSGAFIRASEQYTGVPPVASNSALSYLRVASRYTGTEGVFARNLTLTRAISGPVCYGESLCQDARWEALRLNHRDMMVGDLRVSSRVAEVAQAYLEAVKVLSVGD